MAQEVVNNLLNARVESRKWRCFSGGDDDACDGDCDDNDGDGDKDGAHVDDDGNNGGWC